MSINKANRGFSLIEAVVYVALLAVVSVFVANSFIFLATTYGRTRAEREALANARTVLARISAAIASAQETYGPTSVFDADAGQLSLVTAVTSTPGHTTAYADFWTDNGIVYMSEEGAVPLPLSAASVRITMLKFERIIQLPAPAREAVRMTVRADAAGARFPASATLTTTTALRGNY